MKSTFNQLTVAELKKKLSLGYKLMTYQLESGTNFLAFNYESAKDPKKIFGDDLTAMDF